MKNILIIDDEIDISNNIKAILEDEDYRTSLACNAKETFEKLENRP